MQSRLSYQWMCIRVLLAGIFSLVTEQLYADGYAEDRAQIEDLMARYVISMDWRQPQDYANTFVEDGLIVLSNGKIQGRAALAQLIIDLRNAEEQQDKKVGAMQWRPRQRHYVSNISILVNGDTATSVSYWQALDNRTDRKRVRVHSFGHYQDKLVKVNGEWLFKERLIFNETLWDRKAGFESPLNEVNAADD